METHKVKHIQKLNITWVTRSFLDYRIPVFQCLDELVGGRLHLIFSGDYVPPSVAEKAKAVLGDRAMGLQGEWKIGKEDRQYMANQNISIRHQPGILDAIGRTRPDMLVCDGFFKWTLPALIYRFRYGTPLVVCYERWSHTERHAQWFRIFYRKIALRFIDAMCCNGSLSKEYSIKLGMPANRITIGHMAADTDGLSSSIARVKDSRKRDIRRKFCIHGVLYLYVGRLTKRKGLTKLLDGWTLFEKQPAKSTLLIIGSGEEEHFLKEQCNRLNHKQIRFAGPVPYDKIATFYAAADIFVIPTLEDNWSLVVPEAMACGLPVLCSKYNGCWPELIRDGENGWVFNPFDPDDLLRVLQTALEAKDRLKKMGECSRKIVRRHSPKTAAQAVLDACRFAMRR